MKKTTQLLFTATFLFALFLSAGASASQVLAAKYVPKKIVRKPIVRVVPQIGAPVVTLTYRNHRFTLSAKNVFTSLSYTIAYNRVGGPMEALQGHRKLKVHTFSASLYAGTQSTKYFLPHNVTDGSLEFHSYDKSGNAYTLTKSFVIQKGKLVFTN